MFWETNESFVLVERCRNAPPYIRPRNKGLILIEDLPQRQTVISHCETERSGLLFLLGRYLGCRLLGSGALIHFEKQIKNRKVLGIWTQQTSIKRIKTRFVDSHKIHKSLLRCWHVLHLRAGSWKIPRVFFYSLVWVRAGNCKIGQFTSPWCHVLQVRERCEIHVRNGVISVSSMWPWTR